MFLSQATHTIRLPRSNIAHIPLAHSNFREKPQTTLPIIILLPLSLHTGLSSSQRLRQTTGQTRLPTIRSAPAAIGAPGATHTHSTISRCWRRCRLFTCRSLGRWSWRRCFCSHTRPRNDTIAIDNGGNCCRGCRWWCGFWSFLDEVGGWRPTLSRTIKLFAKPPTIALLLYDLNDLVLLQSQLVRTLPTEIVKSPISIFWRCCGASWWRWRRCACDGGSGLCSPVRYTVQSSDRLRHRSSLS